MAKQGKNIPDKGNSLYKGHSCGSLPGMFKVANVSGVWQWMWGWECRVKEELREVMGGQIPRGPGGCWEDFGFNSE